MSREEELKLLEKLISKYADDSRLAEYEDLEEHRSRNDNNWVSVKDKLPEIGEEVIVTTNSGRVLCVYYGYAYVSDKEPCFHEWDSEMWQCFRPDVIAWMRKPKAYEEVVSND